MQQHLMQMQPLMAAYYPNNVTTDHIQQVLPSSPFLHLFPSLSLLFLLLLITHISYNTCLCIYVCICYVYAFIHHSCPLSLCSGPFCLSTACGSSIYLDENKSLILKIVESQNSGKLSECAENQARLQRNLMYLAAIADSQPQPPTMPGQWDDAAGSTLHAGSTSTADDTATANGCTLLPFVCAAVILSTSTAASHAQPVGGSSGLHMLQSEGSNMNVGSGSATIGGSGGFPDFVRGPTGESLHGRSMIGGSGKQDIGGSGDGRGGSSGEGGESLYLKSAEDGN
ncbi:hypothetical protein ACSQ67_012232 [Phaseolus vulgaris]